MPADAGFLGRNELYEPQGVCQMPACDPHQREQPVGEAGVIVSCGQGAQIEPGFKEDIPRQPAHIAAPVVPYII